MRVLLSDGSGLTARQCATRLAAAGHGVEALSPDPLCLCRFTHHVDRLHRVPPYGSDPFGWLDTALAVYGAGRFDVLLPTQEQVAVLSWATDQLHAAGVATVVPPFAALCAVQDKISAAATLDRLAIPQPHSASDIGGWEGFPAFVKEPIGTASGGVRRVAERAELERAAAGNKAVLVQAAVDGPLVMCQSVFDSGLLVAFHAHERTAEGASGGASHKRSISLPEVRRCFELLGRDLNWHGALSADVILGVDGPVFIDINPRLVEPQNAYLSGVDLVGPMIELATGGHPSIQPEAEAGVETHQLLLAVLGAAQHGRRRDVVSELVHAASRSHDYRRSAEELTPTAHDMESIVPLAMATAATLVAPRSWSWFATGSVSNYALTEQGWNEILHANPTARRHRPNPTTEVRRSQSRPAGASRTAALMAVQRGLESARPSRKRLFNDPLAPSFLGLPWRIALTASRLAAVRTAVETAYDFAAGPGPRASAIARTKLIDDTVEQLAPTVSQVVVLGAGYDTRPYRLACLAGRRVFEVDRPGTQAAKRAVLKHAGIGSSHVVFVPVDFEIDDLAGALTHAGYALDRPTLFLWEGVTQYLSAEAVDDTLAVVHSVGGAGSHLLFTYVDRAVLDQDTAEFPEAAKWLRGVGKRGEPWIFGFDPSNLSGFLAERGFHLVDDLSTAEASVRYFAPLGRRERGSGLYRIATASFSKL